MGSSSSSGTKFVLGVEYEVVDCSGKKTLENFRKYEITEEEYLKYPKKDCFHPVKIPHEFWHLKEGGLSFHAFKAWTEIQDLS